MNLIKQATSNSDKEQFLNEVKTLAPYYEDAARGQHSEMILVGEISKYKNNYGRQSPEWLFYQAILDELSITKDKASNLTRAYNYYHKILAKGVDDYTNVAKAATPTQLLALKEGDKTSVLYDASKYLSKNGRLPTVSAIRSRIKNHLPASFKKQEVQTKPEPNPELKPAQAPEFETHQAQVEKLIADESKPAINDHASARAYASQTGIYPQAKAFLQLIKDTNSVSSETADVLNKISRELQDLQRRGFRSRTDDTYKHYIGNAVM